MKGQIHILSQFLWPDGAPTALYSEQLADSLYANGYSVCLVGGSGTYREAARPRPKVKMIALDHHSGRRESLWSVGYEYCSVRSTFSRYIAGCVDSGDIVIVSSAPPNTIDLARKIHRKGATAVYWLQDYYPQLLRGLWEYPRWVEIPLARAWDRSLRAWDYVVKVAENLGYDGPNARVIRNWPTVQFSEDISPIPQTALYAGNFGYCQHLPSFLKVCRTLANDGYHITVQGDGPGLRQMPKWIETRPPVKYEEDLLRSYKLAEVHIIAAHPDIQAAVFPSKFWNSLASGRRLVFSGFAGAMLAELEKSLAADYSEHIKEWSNFLGTLLKSKANQNRAAVRVVLGRGSA